MMNFSIVRYLPEKYNIQAIPVDSPIFLHRDGTIHTPTTWTLADGAWKTRREAQEFLDEWLPQSEWLSRSAIGNAAKESEKDALWYSILHWRQIIIKGIDEYRKGTAAGKVGTYNKYCAICLRCCHKHIICPLRGNICGGRCIGEWANARRGLTYGSLDGAIGLHNKMVKIYNEKYEDKIMEETKIDDVIVVDGVGYDKETVKAAMKAYEEPPQVSDADVPFDPLDVVDNGMGLRVILFSGDKYHAVDLKDGISAADSEDGRFKGVGYKKIGTLRGGSFHYEDNVSFIRRVQL